jgi:hypothetical protein
MRFPLDADAPPLADSAVETPGGLRGFAPLPLLSKLVYATGAGVRRGRTAFTLARVGLVSTVASEAAS